VFVKITDEQRRARLVARHFASAPTVEDVVSSVLALHATDPASVYLSVLARARSLTIEDVRAAMYTRRSLVRLMAMRRTMFVIAHGDVPTVHAAASLGVARTMRTRLLKQVAAGPTEPAVDDVDAWVAAVERDTEAALRAAGTATGAELSNAVPLLKTAFLPTTDKVYDVKRYVTSEVLTMMAAEGRLVRVEPRGAWTSRRHAWAPIEHWWPEGIPVLDEVEARCNLVRRWLEVFGPATFDDVQWWTGWNKTQTRAALAGLDLVEVELSVGDGIILAGTGFDDAFDSSGPSVMLLPALDPTAMGWKHRNWYLGEYKKPLFDTFGNIGPSIWVDGRIVGGWAVSLSGEVVTALFENVRPAEVAAEAGRLTDLLDGSAVVPSFPTPLEKQLRGR
jgi:hypothetical protein